MSFYGKRWLIDGVPVGMITRGVPANGQYTVTFEREFASLEQIEAINWSAPTVEYTGSGDGTPVLPAGYGFEIADIRYQHQTRSYQVVLRVSRQYLGDVTEYQARLSELTSQNAEKQTTISAQEQEIADLQDQLAEADELAIALYEAQNNSEEETAK